MRSLQRALLPQLDCQQRDWKQSPMLFVTGPRQVGKTHEVKKLSKAYFNWDTHEVKKAYLKDPYFFRTGANWIIFDEIHKRKKDWKKILKSCYDSPDRTENFVVTGSGRFNIYQKGGDSLQGRYELFHLYPVTLDEYAGWHSSVQVRKFASWTPDSRGFKNEEKELIKWGGFPQPLLAGSEKNLNKWLDLYLQRLIEEDVRDFSKVEMLDKMDTLARLLPSRIASPISLQSLSEDVEVSRETIKSWLRIFELLYFGFSVPPYSRKIHRSVKKEKKWYFYQWAYLEDPGARFENYVAVQLYTACQYWRDAGLGPYELYYLRDQDRREVDFLICKNFQPIALIEAKNGALAAWPNSLSYYSEKLKIPGYLLYPDGPVKKNGNKGYSLPSHVFFKGLIG